MSTRFARDRSSKSTIAAATNGSPRLSAGDVHLSTAVRSEGCLCVPDLNLAGALPAAPEPSAAQTLSDAKSASRVDRSIELVALLCVDPLEVDWLTVDVHLHVRRWRSRSSWRRRGGVDGVGVASESSRSASVEVVVASESASESESVLVSASSGRSRCGRRGASESASASGGRGAAS